MFQGNSVEKVEFDSYPTRVDNDPNRDFFFFFEILFHVEKRVQSTVLNQSIQDGVWNFTKSFCLNVSNPGTIKFRLRSA